jgi:hypothetical protein
VFKPRTDRLPVERAAAAGHQGMFDLSGWFEVQAVGSLALRLRPAIDAAVEERECKASELGREVQSASVL